MNSAKGTKTAEMQFLRLGQTVVVWTRCINRTGSLAQMVFVTKRTVVGDSELKYRAVNEV
jgi:hypothetical protein